MKNDYPEDREADAQMLKSARANYVSMKVALEATVERLQAEDGATVKEVDTHRIHGQSGGVSMCEDDC